MNDGLVLGFFDGVHKAHRAVIDSAVNLCDNIYVLTFKDSPALYFGNNAEYILERSVSFEKIRQLAKKYTNKNIQVVEQDFSELANVTEEDYLKNIVKTYHPSVIATGFNHTFGKNKGGNPEFLRNNEQKYGYKYICTEPVKENNEIISSTLIKHYLSQGEVENANKMLESNFILNGIVIHGQKLGRTIGFPTANIKYPKNLIKLPFGVYKGFVSVPNENKKYNAIVNWGMKPTFNNTVEPIIEAHILNFDNDIYGQNIKIEVLKKIRAEQKFSGTEELVVQIKKDINECLKL